MADKKTILEALLGKDEADDTRKNLKEAADMLDKMGLERKENASKQEQDAVEFADKLLQTVMMQLDNMGVLEAAAESNTAPDVTSPDDVGQALAKSAMDLLEEMANAASEDQPTDGEDMPPEDSTPPEDGTQEDKAAAEKRRRGPRRHRRRREVAEGGKSLDGEGEDTADEFELGDELTDALADLMDGRLKELTDTLAKSIEDQGQLAEGVVLIKELAPVVKELVERVGEMEAFIAQGPRQASKDPLTLFTGEKATEAAKSLETSVGEEPELWMGHVPLKRE